MNLLHLESLRKKKNLLAFSSGVDSTALFYLLLEKNIMFDIALVNYKKRSQSDQEEEHARQLAKRYHKKAFILIADKMDGNFEYGARKTRYAFFENILQKELYENLIVAHQLNDRLEWFVFALLKGSGLDSLIGSRALERRFTQAGYIYHLVRPLWFIPKADLYAYLKREHLQYFEDESNRSFLYDRNRIRQQYTDMMIQEHAAQIIHSFTILDQERSLLYPELSYWQRFEDLVVFSYSSADYQNLHYIAKALKSLGYLLSFHQRQEILRQNYQAVVGGAFGIGVNISLGLVFVSPYIKDYCKQHAIKERMRKLKIPKHNRAYLSYHIELLDIVERLFQERNF